MGCTASPRPTLPRWKPPWGRRFGARAGRRQGPKKAAMRRPARWCPSETLDGTTGCRQGHPETIVGTTGCRQGQPKTILGLPGTRPSQTKTILGLAGTRQGQPKTILGLAGTRLPRPALQHGARAPTFGSQKNKRKCRNVKAVRIFEGGPLPGRVFPSRLFF